ncbi:hypothetical protein CCUS01_08292 [Colletotrichum cuscutae]|uniref:Uncharacterized protein n=2 Tax=Colletotrichum acutatum species complex TaxID=2707335 RepID=A0AAJ0DV29_9PEZI|nr:uncharacterized protein CCOS01_14080 [Colletotrichum costaricense]KAK1463604.1 hypothetical protein CCUS01_08292 [Colletotrichum cuscutae]KAK1514140.1 hypothetical protein CCOS01_14080 [Colletotrichum costaricense]
MLVSLSVRLRFLSHIQALCFDSRLSCVPCCWAGLGGWWHCV